MLYFSEIQGKSVLTEDEVYVGRVTDIIFLASENPKITKIILKADKTTQLMIPIRYVIRFGSRILIEKNYENVKITNNELYASKNLLDTQVIDIEGSKIIRVNDVVIAEKPDYHIAGVDIGWAGFLRRLSLEDLAIAFMRFFGKRLTSSFLSWGDIQPLELGSGHVKVKREEKRLDRVRPEDLADYLEMTNVYNVRNILDILDEQKAADVIGELNINYQTALFKHFSNQKIAKIVSLIDPEEAADALLTLPRRRREDVLRLLTPDVKRNIEYLLSVSTTPIGDVLSTEFLTVESDVTASTVVKKIKNETSEFGTVHYVYAINKSKQLVGVFSLHELLLQKPDAVVYKFMQQNLTIVHLTSSEFIVYKKMMKYQLFTLPVIDNKKRLIGVVNFDDIADLVVPFHD